MPKTEGQGAEEALRSRRTFHLAPTKVTRERGKSPSRPTRTSTAGAATRNRGLRPGAERQRQSAEPVPADAGNELDEALLDSLPRLGLTFLICSSVRGILDLCDRLPRNALGLCRTGPKKINRLIFLLERYWASLEGVLVALTSTENAIYTIDSKIHSIRRLEKLPPLLSPTQNKFSRLVFMPDWPDASWIIRASSSRCTTRSLPPNCRGRTTIIGSLS